MQALPLAGPKLLSLRPFRDNNEKMEATMAALEGLSLSARPDLWQPYASAKSEIWQAAKPVTELKARFASQASAIDAVIASTGRKSFWTVFLDPDPVTAEVLAFMPLDSF